MHETTIKLIYLYSLTNKEIAEALGISKGYASQKMNPYNDRKFTKSDHIKLLGHVLNKHKDLLR